MITNNRSVHDHECDLCRRSGPLDCKGHCDGTVTICDWCATNDSNLRVALQSIVARLNRITAYVDDSRLDSRFDEITSRLDHMSRLCGCEGCQVFTRAAPAPATTEEAR